MKALLTCVLVGLMGSLMAQKNFSKEFQFAGSTEEPSYQVQVPAGTQALSLKLKSTLEEGQIQVSLIAPNGESHGQFTLSCQAEEEMDVSVNTQSSGSNVQVQVNRQGKSMTTTTNTNTNTNTSTVTTTTGSGNSNSNSNSSSSSNGSTSSSATSSSISSSGKQGGNSHTYSYSSVSQTDQRSKGTMKRRIAEPEAGTWAVRIEATDATGEVNLKLELE